jgi:outer membrane receptor protein involved in Fe transport
VQVYSGGFPVAYGNALSGLTVIDPLEPAEPLHHELGLSFLYTSGLSSGTFRDGAGEWVVSARRGNLDRLVEDSLGEPSYRDSFAQLALQASPKQRIQLNAVSFDDDVLVTPASESERTETGATDTGSDQLWLTLASDWSDVLASRTLLHWSRFASERRGVVADVASLVGAVRDLRRLRAAGLKQDWEWEAGDRHWVTFGFEAQSLDAGYDYASTGRLAGALAALRPGGLTDRMHALAPDGDSYGLYLADRIRLTDRLIADAGMRWDAQSYLPPGDDSQFSPRLSLLYRLSATSDLRVSYGRFFQSERMLDLQVEDGVLEFAPAQSAAHSIVSFEHRFPGDLTLRAEAFRKWTHSARPRYENLFDSRVLLPELRPDRVRIAPDRAEAEGLEVLVSGVRPFDWWASYAWSQAEDVIDGSRVPRSWDQRFAISGGMRVTAGQWSLSTALALHDGWPTTALALVGGVAAAGSRNADRLGDVRRVDFTAARVFDVGYGSLRFFAELTNATDRRNPCCVRYRVDGGVLEREELARLPRLLNLGILWEF